MYRCLRPFRIEYKNSLAINTGILYLSLLPQCNAHCQLTISACIFHPCCCCCVYTHPVLSLAFPSLLPSLSFPFFSFPSFFFLSYAIPSLFFPSLFLPFLSFLPYPFLSCPFPSLPFSFIPYPFLPLPPFPFPSLPFSFLPFPSLPLYKYINISISKDMLA